MNLGYYEMMDRVSVIQNSLEDNVYNHVSADVDIQEKVDNVQYCLNKLYDLCSEKFYDSCDDSDINEVLK